MSAKILRAVLVGARGRMGRAIASLAPAEAIEIIREIDLGDPVITTGADVLIDFSQPACVIDFCSEATRTKTALVIGTTGHSEKERKVIEQAAKETPIVLASNFSVGVNALFALSERAAAILGDSFDVEIVEAHHRLKKDAPSGTAKTLAEILACGSQKKIRYGREGMVGERAKSEIGIHSVRGGDVVGDHTVIFAGDGERLELTHRATNRETFARGALRAARWIVDQPAGLYSMRDVLGL